MIKSWEWRWDVWDEDESMCVESEREEGAVHGSCDEVNARRERRIWSGSGEQGKSPWRVRIALSPILPLARVWRRAFCREARVVSEVCLA